MLNPDSFGSDSFAGEVAAYYKSIHSRSEDAEMSQIETAEQRIEEVLSNPNLRRPLKPREIHRLVGHHLNRVSSERIDGERVARIALIFLADPERIGGRKIEFTEGLRAVRLASSQLSR